MDELREKLRYILSRQIASYLATQHKKELGEQYLFLEAGKNIDRILALCSEHYQGQERKWIIEQLECALDTRVGYIRGAIEDCIEALKGE